MKGLKITFNRVSLPDPHSCLTNDAEASDPAGKYPKYPLGLSQEVREGLGTQMGWGQRQLGNARPPPPWGQRGTFPGVTSAGLEPHILLKKAFIRKKLLGGCCGMLRWECGDNAEPQERGAGSGGDIGGVIKKRS